MHTLHLTIWKMAVTNNPLARMAHKSDHKLSKQVLTGDNTVQQSEP